MSMAKSFSLVLVLTLFISNSLAAYSVKPLPNPVHREVFLEGQSGFSDEGSPLPHLVWILEEAWGQKLSLIHI